MADPAAPLTKEQKMRYIIRRELERSFLPGLTKQLNAHAPFVRKLNAHPKFIEAVTEELIELQLPFYMMAEDHVADAAYAFFTTPEGAAWCDLCGRFNDKLMQIIPPFLADVVRRLDALTLN